MGTGGARELSMTTEVKHIERGSFGQSLQQTVGRLRRPSAKARIHSQKRKAGRTHLEIEVGVGQVHLCCRHYRLHVHRIDFSGVHSSGLPNFSLTPEITCPTRRSVGFDALRGRGKINLLPEAPSRHAQSGAATMARNRFVTKGWAFFLVLLCASHAHVQGIEETEQFQDCLRDPPSCLYPCVPSSPKVVGVHALTGCS
jgi:hypothetical protein